MMTSKYLGAAMAVACALAATHTSNAQSESGEAPVHRACAVTVSPTSGHESRGRATARDVVLRVRVMDPAGKSLEGAVVSQVPRRHSAETDARGEAMAVIPEGDLPASDSMLPIVVRRIGYAALTVGIRAVPGDDFTITAVLCTNPEIMPMEIVPARHAGTPSGRVTGVVRDRATGQPVRRAFVSATMNVGGRFPSARSSRIDSTGAYHLDSLGGVVRFGIQCSTVRPIMGKEILVDTLSVGDSAVIRRDWTVDTTGCDPRPLRHVTGIFRGHYTPGFESSEFVPCAADAWFIPGDSLDVVTAYDPRRAWVTWSPGTTRGLVVADSGPRNGYGNPRYYVRWRGTVTGPGQYGHMGVSAFEIRVDSVLEIRGATAHDCPVR